MSIPLKRIIEKHAGGVKGGWDNLLVLYQEAVQHQLYLKMFAMNVLMDYDSLIEHKSGLGTGAVIVINKSQDIIKCISRLSDFFTHESCGQCTPCREGCDWISKNYG